ncbi:hypothetical protein Goe27_00240 [Bacillus phage vB_BsuM-Goe27]|nr:hypothetical protein Goe27_00240 [Bacillus phage vB_BsuM-Goe27]
MTIVKHTNVSFTKVKQYFAPKGGKVYLTPQQVLELNSLMEHATSFRTLYSAVATESQYGEHLSELSAEEIMWVSLGGDYEVKPDFLFEMDRYITDRERKLEHENLLSAEEKTEITAHVNALKFAVSLYLEEKEYKKRQELEESTNIRIDKEGLTFNE